METQSQEEKLEFWSLVVEEFENSNKSIKEQCEYNNIPLSQYYNWRRKIRESEQDDAAAFIELESLGNSDSEPSEVGVFLEYSQDFKISLSEDFNPAVLRSVMKVLMSL